VGAVANSTWSSFFDGNKRQWTIKTLFDDDAIEVPVDDQAYFPGWDPTTFSGDFLLLHLEKKVCVDTPSLTLEEDPDLPVNGTLLTVVGLGLYREDPPKSGFGLTPPQLMETESYVIDFETCLDLQEEYNEELFNAFNLTVDDESMFCNIYFKKDHPVGGQASCKGDSGGPVLYIDEDGNQVLMGLVSWGLPGCGEPMNPDVNARVSFAFDWIKTTVCDKWGEEASFCPGGVKSCGSDGDKEDKEAKDDDDYNDDDYKDDDDKDDDKDDKEDKDD
jgi:hypothetical protein